MPPVDLAPVADASAFIFTGSITRAGAATMATVPVNDATVVVTVDDVVKAPLGMRSFAGHQVTVQLQRPLAAGRYVFFADPLAVGGGLAVRERAHLDASSSATETEAAEAVERGYAARIEPQLKAATLVALGAIGEVRPLLPPAERRGRVPWALARFAIEQVLKGDSGLRGVTLVGPVRASKRLPHAPALRPGLRAILLLQPPPGDALELVPRDDRREIAFIAEPSDIQPPERLPTLARILGNTR